MAMPNLIRGVKIEFVYACICVAIERKPIFLLFTLCLSLNFKLLSYNQLLTLKNENVGGICVFYSSQISLFISKCDK